MPDSPRRRLRWDRDGIANERWIEGGSDAGRGDSNTEHRGYTEVFKVSFRAQPRVENRRLERLGNEEHQSTRGDDPDREPDEPPAERRTETASTRTRFGALAFAPLALLGALMRRDFRLYVAPGDPGDVATCDMAGEAWCEHVYVGVLVEYEDQASKTTLKTPD